MRFIYTNIKRKIVELMVLPLLLVTSICYAQDNEIKRITSYPNPSIIINWSYNSWLDVPEKMEVSPLSMGFDLYGMYPLIGKNSFVSLAGGVGLSVQNIKSNSYLISADSSYFMPLPSQVDYTKNKMTTVFVDVPIELRLRSRPKPPNKSGKVRKRNIKFAMGFKVGYNVQSYIKYDGDNLTSQGTGETTKYKEYRLKNISLFRYGVYARLGYGKFSAYGYYALTNVFEKKKGPELRPFAIGLSITI